jgi:SNF2 family DNA or RNA helicase
LQIANGAIYTGEDSSQWSDVHDEKLRALESIVEESGGAPILVAYHFKSDLARLQKAFPQGRALDKDSTTIDAWNAGKIPLLFCHPMSAGHGLSLQDGGNILVFFGHWWNLEERLQVIERIGPTRQAQSGYDRPVFIYNLIAKDTVDELVIERIASKKSIQDLLLERMKMKEPAHGYQT